jgi:hypothetical protein
MRFPKMVEIINDKIIATAALKVINPKREAPGDWCDSSKYLNK